MIIHDSGLITTYAHLSRVDVPAGARVESGDTVGLSGNTGNSTGAHLHFEVRDQTQSGPTDPLPLMYSPAPAAEADYPPVTAGTARIACDTANLRDPVTMEVIGTIKQGATVEVTSEPVTVFGLPYRDITIRLRVAEHDAYGNRILENVV